jgi:hypothetical protein
MFNISVVSQIMELDDVTLDTILSALGDQLATQGERFEIVVVGGSALLVLGLVTRTTKDIDVVALADRGVLRSSEPLPETLRASADRVARDFGLSEDWLNSGPTDLLRLGLPEGFWSRIITRHYGDALSAHFASRVDQVHFKLFATVDQGGGRHEADLRALRPTRDELIAAARWTITHDPSPGFHEVLSQALNHLGVEDVHLGP